MKKMKMIITMILLQNARADCQNCMIFYRIDVFAFQVLRNMQTPYFVGWSRFYLTDPRLLFLYQMFLGRSYFRPQLHPLMTKTC